MNFFLAWLALLFPFVRMISTGQCGQIPVNDQVKALHLEVT
jgi:hypothetical protein